MDTLKLQSLRNLSKPQAWLWIWFFGSAFAVGVYVGNLVPVGFHPLYFLGGFVGGLVANIPVWVIFDMLRRVVLTQQEVFFASRVSGETSTD